MARILLNIVRICNTQFKSKYLKNEKNFRYFLFHFSKLHQILNILKKKMMVMANVLPKLKGGCEKVRHTTLWEAPFRSTFTQSTCESVPNTCQISMRVLLSYFSITLMEVDLENISPSVRLNVRGVCWHIDCR